MQIEVKRTKWMERDPGCGAWKDIDGRWNSTGHGAQWTVFLAGHCIGNFADGGFKSRAFTGPTRQSFGPAVEIFTARPSVLGGQSRWAQVQDWLRRLAEVHGIDTLVERCQTTDRSQGSFGIAIWTWRRDNRLQ